METVVRAGIDQRLLDHAKGAAGAAAAGSTMRAEYAVVRVCEARADALERLIMSAEARPARHRLAAYLTGRDASLDVQEALKGRNVDASSIEGAKKVLLDLRGRVDKLRAGRAPEYDPDVIFTERMGRLHAIAQSIRERRIQLISERDSTALKGKKAIPWPSSAITFRPSAMSVS